MATTAIGDDLDTRELKGWRLLKVALRQRKTAIMLVFGFSSGLPFSLLVGTLNAWLGEAKVDLATIGIISWIGLAYAFKFLWSPLVDRTRLPLLGSLGRRRGWLLLCQIVLAGTFLALSLTNPVLAIGTFALVAVIGAFASATQDVVIDAWRIDVADDRATVDILSSIYQMGFRTAALVGGALALVLSARISWPGVYAVMGVVMALTIIATLLAPDTARAHEDRESSALREQGAIDPRVRAIALGIVALGWLWAIYTIAAFMVRMLNVAPGDPNPPKASDFTASVGPWIIAITVVLPMIIAAWLDRMKSQGRYVIEQAAPARTTWDRAADHAYNALLLPLTDLIRRLGWGAVIVFGIILTYRLTDSIWGPFAFPFYLGEMQYTADEVAFASKVFGVFMTIAGIAIGGIMFVTLGRMPTLMIGAILAAATNLLYADLAAGGAAIDAFANLFGLNALGADPRMVRLMVAISGENIAGGLAGAAYVAYLSSIASKEFSAVQYALLSSLTLLVGSLGRGALGEMIDTQGYVPVFYLTAALGGIAVVFCALEWLRSERSRRSADPSRLPQSDAARVMEGDTA
ncbi:AmpG family muropeptide MFS transporter [Sphingomonas sp. GCM10030256]|uniref:AmpG family muropeptide MFS transporter n=1 Tax=Sphingomonas sp. GCM10030256 TaxID=3273427 RepID=UPI00361E15AC